MKSSRITIICDASFCPDTGAGGWAAWTAGDRGRRQFSAHFQNPTSNPELAEMMAIVNAIYTSVRAGVLEQGSRVLIQSDCMGAIEKLKNPSAEKNPEYVLVLNHYCATLRRFCLTVDFRHVKAHVEIKDRRTWVQDWCDATAKEQMRRMRSKLKKQNDAKLSRTH